MNNLVIVFALFTTQNRIKSFKLTIVKKICGLYIIDHINLKLFG